MRPDHGTEMVVSKFESAVLHSLKIPKGMVLFFLQGSKYSLAKRIGSVWEFEQSECHELNGEQFVVCKEVE